MTHHLEQLAPGVYAWLAEQPSNARGNAGVVIAADGLTVVDTLATPSQAGALAASLGGLVDLPVRRIVYTSSHIGNVGGGTAFPLAAVFGRAQTSHHLDQPGNPDAWAALLPEHAGEFPHVETRPVTHTVDEAAYLCPASIAVPTAGHQFENLVVQVPAADVVFAGSMASFGVTPLALDGDFPVWIESLELLKSLGARCVPGHGPIGGHADIDVLSAYLQACIAAGGVLDRLSDGPWREWTDPQFHAVNVERAHMLAAGDPSPPPAALRLLGGL